MIEKKLALLNHLGWEWVELEGIYYIEDLKKTVDEFVLGEDLEYKIKSYSYCIEETNTWTHLFNHSMYLILDENELDIALMKLSKLESVNITYKDKVYSICKLHSYYVNNLTDYKSPKF